MKKIAVGDLGEFWYGDYKEPFVELEGGVPGYPQGTVLKDDTGKLLCAFCGKTYENLGNHVHKHGLTATTYKREVGLMTQSALVSERQRLTRVSNGKRRAKDKTWMKVGGMAEGRTAAYDSRRSAEALNKSGRCYAQLLETARTIQRERGRVTVRALAQHGINWPTLRMYFDSIEALGKAIGSDTGSLKRANYDKGALLTSLRTLAQRLGRTPSQSDLRRYGMPTTKVYARRWGSYAAACEAAGLVPNPVSPGSQSPFDPVRLLNAYATTGNSDTAAESLGISSKAILGVLHRYGYPFPPFYKGPGRKEWAADMARRLAGEDQAA